MNLPPEIIAKIPDIGTEAFSLYCYMLSIADGNMQTTADYETMRQAIRASKTTVRQALERLRAAGLIVWKPRFKQSNLYTIAASTQVVLAEQLTTTTINKEVVNKPASTQVVLAEGNIFSLMLAQDIYRAVTGQVTFPGDKREMCIDTLRQLWLRHHDETASYLSPFWREWCSRKYSRANTAWLTAWAVGGEIPRNGKKPIKEEVFAEEW